MNGGDGAGKLVVLVLVVGCVLGWLWLRWQRQQIGRAADRLRSASAAGHLKSVRVEQSRRRILLRVAQPLDAGWLIQPAGGIAAVRSIVPGLTVTADPARSVLVVEL